MKTSRKQQINHIVALMALAAFLEEQLAVRIYLAGFNASRCPVINALRNKLNALKQQGRETVFELMLHSSHRQFMRFLREHG